MGLRRFRERNCPPVRCERNDRFGRCQPFLVVRCQRSPALACRPGADQTVLAYTHDRQPNSSFHLLLQMSSFLANSKSCLPSFPPSTSLLLSSRFFFNFFYFFHLLFFILFSPTLPFSQSSFVICVLDGVCETMIFSHQKLGWSREAVQVDRRLAEDRHAFLPGLSAGCVQRHGLSKGLQGVPVHVCTLLCSKRSVKSQNNAFKNAFC